MSAEDEMRGDRFARLRRWVFLTAAGFAVAGALIYTTAVLERESRVGWARYESAAPAGEAEARLEATFLGDDSAETRYVELLRYLLDGFVRHASAGYERVQYGGAGSNAGYRADGLEGFARTAPVFAAWVHGGRDRVVELENGERVDLVAVLERGVSNGLDPASPAYWGDIAERFDQRVVEAVDIARILWLTRDSIWDRWPDEKRSNARRWLEAVERVELRDGNWALFPIVVRLILDDLDGGAAESKVPSAASAAFAEYTAAHYLENGWFADDPRGVDFYNAWSISYELFWMHRIAPAFHGEFVTRAIDESAALTEHLISPEGIPILGRSLCYRTAVPVPVVAASLIESSPGHRRGVGFRALDAVWRYFVERHALRDGALTQGYFGDDLRILDGYSGTGSCHWGLRSLVLAFMHGPDAAFWNAAPAPLPVEVSDYALELPKLGWRVIGRQSTREIVIEVAGNDAESIDLDPMTWQRRAIELLTRRPDRPSNRRAKYDLAAYSSARPFMADADR